MFCRKTEEGRYFYSQGLKINELFAPMSLKDQVFLECKFGNWWSKSRQFLKTTWNYIEQRGVFLLLRWKLNRIICYNPKFLNYRFSGSVTSCLTHARRIIFEQKHWCLDYLLWVKDKKSRKDQETHGISGKKPTTSLDARIRDNLSGWNRFKTT